jgi:23S rRNA pseudoU1915 N3-methylase RlmH
MPRQRFPHITFVIGGPDGLGDRVKASADRLISFGRVTWPHQIVRFCSLSSFTAL